METIYNYNNRQVGSGNQLVSALAQLQVDASGNYEGRNPLLTSLLLPKLQTAMYPPTGRQQTNTKAVDIATLVAVEPWSGFTNDLLFVIPEESPVPFIHVYRRSTEGYSYFHGFIRTSESMQDTAKYRCSRLVSSLIEISSDTRPGGNFDISGQFNAITLAYLPPKFQSLDHNQLLKFKDSPSEVRTNVPILDGIAYRKGLSEENPMLVRSQLAASYNYGQDPQPGVQWWRPTIFANSTRVEFKYTDNDSGSSGVQVAAATTAGITTAFSISGDATERLPSLAIYSVQYSISVDTTTDAQTDDVTARVYMRYSDQEYIDVPLAYLNPSGDIKTTTHMEASFYAFSTVEKVEILLSAAPNKQIFRQHLNLTCCLASNESTDKQATVISVRGVPNGVTYSISGRLNYEFIAGSELKADLMPEPNTSTHTDLHAALRVQEYLCDSVSVGHVMTCSEYRHFVQEVAHNLFDRARHSRYAFLGAILPALRTAIQYGPRVLQMGSAVAELSRDLHAAYRDHKKQRRAMLGNSKLSSLLPSRGNAAKAFAQFNPSVQAQPALPEALSMRCAGDRFQVSRQFATVDSDGNAEQGELTVSTEPLNEDSYTYLDYSGVRIHHQNYNFGDQVVTQEDIVQKLESKAQDAEQYLILYRDQEPLRTLAWMAKTKDLTEIYLTSDLEGVSGGSAGFTLEAIWFGYLKEYVYTGSSSPDTCWLPSYPLDEGLALKAQLDKIAAKTVASELAESKDFGYTVPLTFDGKTFPNKVCVESSTWFMEVLLDTTKPGKCPPVQSVNTVTVVKDSPETLARIQSLEATISTLTRQLQAASKPMTLQDYFINPRPAEGKVLKVPATDLPAKVSGYPQTSVAMEDAAVISKIIGQLEDAQIPDEMPESVREVIKSLPKEQKVQLDQYLDMVEGRQMPRSREHGFGLASLYKSFLKNQLPMLEDAQLLAGPGEGMSLIDFLRAHNIPQSRGGVVTNAEYQKALAAANFDKAVEKGKMTSADAALRKAEMLAVKPSAGQKKAAKKAREASKQVIAPPVQSADPSTSLTGMKLAVDAPPKVQASGGSKAMTMLLGMAPSFGVDQ